MNALRVTLLGALILSAAFATAANPTPFVNQPLIPASIAPGGPDFTLTVNGTGFVSGSTVNWNGSPRATTFVNGSQLTATILATDIASANTDSVSVSSPGAGTSNVVFMPVRQPATFVSMNAGGFAMQPMQQVFTGADFNNDGNQDIAVELFDPATNVYSIAILLGNGDGTFVGNAQYAIVSAAYSFLTADENGDGNLDLLFPGYDSQGQFGLWVRLGNGDGTFQQPAFYTGTACCQYALGDFNRDGVVDVVSFNGADACIFPGNGDGSFGMLLCTRISPAYSLIYPVVGDFNGDGKLDLASTASAGNGTFALGVSLGNGDGTFQLAQIYNVSGSAPSLTTADFNGDGKLDLAVLNQNLSTITIYLGNGDGNFQTLYSVATGYGPNFITTADMNGDGKLDIVVSDYGFALAPVSVHLGNGDGTFQTYLSYGGPTGAGGLFAVADFTQDGRFDVAVQNFSPSSFAIMIQDDGSAISLSAGKLNFPTQLVNTVSNPKLLTLTNTGSTSAKISKISISPNFSQLNNCRTLQPNQSCKVGVFFTPSQSGDLPGYLSITDDAGGSPQIINLTGTATVVSFSPSKLDFGELQVGKVSAPQSVLLTNQGNSSLTINEVGIGGQNSKDFLQVNACPNKLPAGASCTITVYFHPTAQGSRNAILGVKDSGGGSPQKVPLSGAGT